jgi:hypothetical protein
VLCRAHGLQLAAQQAEQDETRTFTEAMTVSTLENASNTLLLWMECKARIAINSNG